MRWPLAVLCCCAAVVGSQRTASATPAEAQDLAARATKRARQGDQRGAIEFLEKAFDADPQSDYLLQLAQQYESVDEGDARDLRLAIAFYRECLSTEKNPAEVQSLQDHLRRLRERLSLADSAGPPPSKPAAPPQQTDAGPPPARRPAPVTIAFEAGNEKEHFGVTVAGRSCQTPCTLALFPGRYTLRTTGSDNEKLTMDVPPLAGTVHLVSSGDRFLIPGILLTVIGPLVAATLWSLEYACPSSSDVTCQGANDAIWPTLGGVAFVTGIAFLGYWGSHRVTTADVEIAPSGAAPGPRLSSVGFQPMRNGAGAGLGLSF